MRAARAYKGLPSVRALAEAIGEDGLGTTTLYAIEQGRRHARPRERAAIAAACDLPPAFFSVDFSTIQSHPSDLEERLADLEKKVAAAALESLADDLAALRRLVEVNGEEARPR